MKFNFNNANRTLLGLLKNKYVLYSVSAVSVANILAYLSKKNYKAVIFFLAITLLTTYFSKNMIINLAVGLFLTNILYSNKTLEGMENAEEEVVEEEVVEEEPEEQEEIMEEEEPEEEEEEEEPEEEEQEEIMEEEEEQEEIEENDNLGMTDNLNEAFTLLSSRIVEGMENKKPKKKVIVKKGKKKQGFQTKQMNTHKSMPSSLTDESIGERIDYASTLEQAYSNLEGMLGKEGIKGLTKETQSLIKQQKNLMGTLGDMQPLIKSAKDTLSTFNMGELNKGIGNISSMLKGLKQ